MEPREARLNALGEELDQLLAEATRASDQVRDARDGVLYRVALGPKRATGAGFLAGLRPRSAFAALGAAAALAAGLWLWLRIPISFEIGGTGVASDMDAAIAAPAGESVPLRFSEGSSVVIRPGGRVRVLGTEANGAHVLLESGAVDVAIAHRGQRGAAWSFDAGPLSVHVTGTRFQLAYSPRDQRFSLAISEGSVVVSGSCLPRARTFAAGETFTTACGTAEGAPVGAPAPAASVGVSGPALVAQPSASPAKSVEVQAPSAAPASSAAVEKTWREWMREGDIDRAYRAAVAAGFTEVCRTATRAELLSLADGARGAGDIPRAGAALTSLRERFAGSPDAAAAAFTLGRLAFERRGAYADAVRWFSKYLEEAPNGPLMGDAVGRLMEARHRQGDRAGARADAEHYLRRFPKGPYAALARQLLAER
ncbi:MAG TPA: tetratricopeptide repeat protein [Polyangiaceae bacterium]